MSSLGEVLVTVIREMGIESDCPRAAAEIAVSSLWHSGLSQQRTPGCQKGVEGRKQSQYHGLTQGHTACTG